MPAQSSGINNFISTIDQTQTSLTNNAVTNLGLTNSADGFTVPPTPSSDGTGLPYNKVNNNRDSFLKRNIIHWFIPEFGVVKMYVNPQNITYSNRKLISRDRTKGGFTLQYWGEDLTTLSIRGTTGSSGIEGINVLEEIYRAEQYAFDSVGLSLAANSAAADISNNLVQGLGGALGEFIGGSGGASVGAGLLGGILGLDSPNNNLAQQNIPSLAQLAFTVELYYNGWVYRGFFENMNFTESADNFLLQYDINFVATQRRGYRTNYFPWSKSAKDGPSSYSTPTSFNGKVIAR